LKQQQCQLCHEYWNEDLIRYYEYMDDMNTPILYSICEDCVIHHKKYNLKLGQEVLCFDYPCVKHDDY
jgi:hypothetical protein